ncbi:DUF4198 domain-containing protein [Rhodophyticola sp. SM2404]
MRKIALAATLVAVALIGKVQAHEFWIEPLEYRADTGAEITANLRIGSEYEGSLVSYLPRNFTRFDVVQGDVTRPVEGRLGDSPALSMADMADGLAIVLHETTESTLTWSEWARFANFAEHKDFEGYEAHHEARGLPRDGFRESYSRHVKALIAVGDGAGEDRAFGLLTEIVALANPYTDDLSEGLAVQVFYQGAIRPDTQVELFSRGSDGVVEITYHRTDTNGVSILPMEAGHEYLVDAVVLEDLEPSTENDPVYRTRWAALTFMTPAQ